MAYLQQSDTPLSHKQAAHLLRRVTFGPTRQEIADFTGLKPADAVKKLFDNVAVTQNPPPPIDYDETKSTAGQEFIKLPFDKTRRDNYNVYLRYWWAGLMCIQNGKPSVLEKLSAFWQNHWVVSQGTIGDYRMSYRYLDLIRQKGLGSFRTLAIEMTKDPGMLLFQNGHDNQKGRPNENYARELQELFTVGEKDFNGNRNYTEDDVKEAARALTGWQVTNWETSTSVSSVFVPARHDTGNKTFSSKYGNKTIQGRSDQNAGDQELQELIDMLLAHPETPKFICRKLYRWYVNTNVTQEIEDNVIIPLAQFFSSPDNNYQIKPVLEKLFRSEIFFDSRNVGALIKSPAEFGIGMLRHFNQVVPDSITDYVAFRKLMEFVVWNMSGLQLNLLHQSLVFGSIPYYQTGYTKNWVNGSTVGIRGTQVDKFVHPGIELKPGLLIGIDLLAWATSLQPNFSDVAGTPAITAEYVFDELVKDLFVFDLSLAQKNFLIDNIMMTKLSRQSWITEWNRYRKAPTEINNRNAVMWRCQLVLRYMMRMAEYYIF